MEEVAEVVMVWWQRQCVVLELSVSDGRDNNFCTLYK